MRTNLTKLYGWLLFPAVLLFSIFFFLKNFLLIDIPLFTPSQLFSGTVFILASITAVAGPLFLRSLFAHNNRNHTTVSLESFIKFQRKLIILCMITPYWAFIAFVFEFEKFFSAAILLMALYALYYYYPSEKRINFDKRIFRIDE